MKTRSNPQVILVVAAIVMVSCNSSKTETPVGVETYKAATEQQSEQRNPSAATELDHAKTQVAEAVQATQDYAYAQKNEFVDNTKQQLSEIQSELDDLAIKIDHSGGVAKAEAKAKLKSVNEKWDQAKMQLDKAENATESNWNTVMDGFKQSYGDLKDAFDSTRQWLSDKIEP